MNIKISERVDKVANYIIKSNKTVREISKVFHVSKSTIHKDLHDRLKLINKEKYKEVNKILQYHISIRHIKGGETTKNKYLNMHKYN